MNMVTSLKGFSGKKESCNERILEAIQALWIEEKD
jgi:FeS assembly protein IscX